MWNGNRPFLRIFAVTLLFGASIWGQTGSGTIRGTVTDASSAVLPGAQITITNEATNVAQQTLTNDQGVYVVPFLPPGSYIVAAVENRLTSSQANRRGASRGR